MGIDISNISEEELLEVLGDGDWVLTLPGDYPDVVISIDMRQDLYDGVAHTFVEWVMRGIEVVIEHHLDPEWDRSGSASRYERDSLMLLIKYETIEEWLTEAYTGNSHATFVSGYGLRWDTYENAFEEQIQEIWYELIQAIADTRCKNEDEKDEFWDNITDDTLSVELKALRALRLYIGQGTTQAVWKKYQSVVAAELHQEQEEAKERHFRQTLMRERVQRFHDLHFADLPRERMEMPQFREFDFENRLKEALLDADPDLVDALAEVGLPIAVSNKVSDKITMLLREILKELQ